MSTVAGAEPGSEFAWVVGDNFVRWGYTLDSVTGGTQLTESWNFLPDGIAHFDRKFGDDAQTKIDTGSRAALDGIPSTLTAIKRIVESAVWLGFNPVQSYNQGRDAGARCDDGPLFEADDQEQSGHPPSERGSWRRLGTFR